METAASSRARSRSGAHGDGYSEILDGVKAGEKVVTTANFLIDAESNLRAAIKGFSPAKPDADTGTAAAEARP